eukprot:scaffold31676_cov79-Isochrysis_galbana.AAC.1
MPAPPPPAVSRVLHPPPSLEQAASSLATRRGALPPTPHPPATPASPAAARPEIPAGMGGNTGGVPPPGWERGDVGACKELHTACAQSRTGNTLWDGAGGAGDPLAAARHAAAHRAAAAPAAAAAVAPAPMSASGSRCVPAASAVHAAPPARTATAAESRTPARAATPSDARTAGRPPPLVLVHVRVPPPGMHDAHTAPPGGIGVPDAAPDRELRREISLDDFRVLWLSCDRFALSLDMTSTADPPAPAAAAAGRGSGTAPTRSASHPPYLGAAVNGVAVCIAPPVVYYLPLTEETKTGHARTSPAVPGACAAAAAAGHTAPLSAVGAAPSHTLSCAGLPPSHGPSCAGTPPPDAAHLSSAWALLRAAVASPAEKVAYRAQQQLAVLLMRG